MMLFSEEEKIEGGKKQTQLRFAPRTLKTAPKPYNFGVQFFRANLHTLLQWIISRLATHQKMYIGIDIDYKICIKKKFLS